MATAQNLNFATKISNAAARLSAVANQSSTPSLITLIHLLGNLLHLLYSEPRTIDDLNIESERYLATVENLHRVVLMMDRAYLRSLKDKKLQTGLSALCTAGNSLTSCVDGVHPHYNVRILAHDASYHINEMLGGFEDIVVEFGMVWTYRQLAEVKAQIRGHNSEVTGKDLKALFEPASSEADEVEEGAEIGQ